MKRKRKQRKQLSKRGLAGLILAAGVLVLAAGWFLAVSPLRAKARDYDAQAAQTEQQVASNRAAAASGANGAPQIRTADVYRLAAAMPASDGMPDLLLQVAQAAHDAGVTLTSVTPSAAAAGTSGYTTLPIAVVFDGNFYSITDMLYRLRSLVSVRHGALDARGRLLSMQQVQLAPAAKSKQRLTATVNLVAYVYGSDGLAAPPSATTDSTSTSTESTSTTTTSGGS